MKSPSDILPFSMLLLLAVLLYIHCLGFGFIWDDYLLVVNNGFIKDLSNPRALFSPLQYVYEGSQFRGYRILTSLMYAVEYALFGLKPFIYHLSSLLLHISCTFLAYIFFMKILGSKGLAFLGATLFAVHPIHSEAVISIFSRTNLLGTFFALLSFIFYIHSLENKEPTKYGPIKKTGNRGPGGSMVPPAGGLGDRVPQKGQSPPREKGLYCLSVLFFALALLSKEVTIILPLLILLYDLCFGWLRPYRYLPFFGLALLYLGLWLSLFGGFEGVTPWWGGSPMNNMLMMSYVFLKYLQLLLVPIFQRARYEVPLVDSFFQKEVMLFLALVAGLVFFCLKASRKSLFLVLWFFVSLLPVSNLVPIPGSMMGDRFLYMASVGFFGLVAMGLHKTLSISRRCGISLIIAIILLLSFLTIKRGTVWKDEVTFYRQMALDNPLLDMPHLNLGNVYDREGLMELAQREYEEALRLNPKSALALANLSAIYQGQGKNEKTLEVLQKAIETDPHCAKAYYNLGVQYQLRGQWDKARKAWLEALRQDPTLSPAHNNLGNLYLLQGLWEEAIEEYRKAVFFDPTSYEAVYNLAQLLEKNGQRQEALRYYQIFLKGADPAQYGQQMERAREQVTGYR